MEGVVASVSTSPGHTVSKTPRPSIRLLAGVGAEGDTHAGETVQHRSRLKRTPGAPNLRQVHLLPAELHEELAAAGFVVGPGAMGENVTTRGIDLLGLPAGTRLRLGSAAVVVAGGEVRPGDAIRLELPGGEQCPLEPV